MTDEGVERNGKRNFGEGQQLQSHYFSLFPLSVFLMVIYTIKRSTPSVRCLRIVVERRTWSQIDRLIMKKQLKYPIPPFFY